MTEKLTEKEKKDEIMEKFVAKAENSVNSAPILYGLFFEDINHSLDGGLNANLVQNGFFDFCYFNYGSINLQCVHDNLRFWSCEPQKNILITDEKPIHPNNPFALKVSLSNRDGDVILKNFGYAVKDNQNFLFLSSSKCECSFFAASSGRMKVDAFFEYEDGTNSKSYEIELKETKIYKNYKFNLSCKAQTYARICFKVSGVGQAYFSGFRLIPNNFFKSATNSYPYGKLNAKLVEALDMGTKFLRFPGGCLVEGDVCPNFLYDWEKTIGPIETRVSKPSVWNYTQSNEIGFFEYFCLCEDLNLLPVPVHHLGLNCQIRTEVFRHQGYSFLKPNSAQFKEKVIDSVAHLIYFAKGKVSSKDATEKLWAEKRKKMGHPKPFNLQHIALGNENWDKIYFKNFETALQGLKNYDYCGKNTDILEKFNIQIIASAGVDINPQDTNFSWKYITKHHQNLVVDEHCYNTPQWFVDNFYRYDYYDKAQSKVFMGEYACHTDADGKGRLGGKNNFVSALSEAVFMCGFENNPQIVKMSCYAPLLCRKNSANWDPNLIYFDRDEFYPTPNYCVQKLFMQNYGDHAIKLEKNENFENCGIFSIKTNKNSLKSVVLGNGEKLAMQLGLFDTMESSQNLENFSATISFKKIKDDISFCFGKQKQEGFGFYLHYNFEEKKLYFEKVVDSLRMTLEELANVELSPTVRVEYDQHMLKIYNLENGKVKLVAKKNIWKTNRTLFASLTYDEKNIYIKVVNVSKNEQTVSFVFDEKLLPSKKFVGKLITAVANRYDPCTAETAISPRKYTQREITEKILPESINVLTIKR